MSTMNYFALYKCRNTDDEVTKHWNLIGETNGLNGDREIARFLLSAYLSPSRQGNGRVCSGCGLPLSQVCTNAICPLAQRDGSHAAESCRTSNLQSTCLDNGLLHLFDISVSDPTCEKMAETGTAKYEAGNCREGQAEENALLHGLGQVNHVGNSSTQGMGLIEPLVLYYKSYDELFNTPEINASVHAVVGHKEPREASLVALGPLADVGNKECNDASSLALRPLAVAGNKEHINKERNDASSLSPRKGSEACIFTDSGIIYANKQPLTELGFGLAGSAKCPISSSSVSTISTQLGDKLAFDCPKKSRHDSCIAIKQEIEDSFCDHCVKSEIVQSTINNKEAPHKRFRQLDGAQLAADLDDYKRLVVILKRCDDDGNVLSDSSSCHSRKSEHESLNQQQPASVSDHFDMTAGPIALSVPSAKHLNLSASWEKRSEKKNCQLTGSDLSSQAHHITSDIFSQNEREIPDIGDSPVIATESSSSEDLQLPCLLPPKRLNLKSSALGMTINTEASNTIAMKTSETIKLAESTSFDSTNITSSLPLVNEPVTPSTTVAKSVRKRKLVKFRHSKQQNLVLDLNKKSLSSSALKYKFSSNEELNVLKQTKIKLPLCKSQSHEQKEMINLPSLNMSGSSSAALQQQETKGKIRSTAFDKQSSAKPNETSIVKAQSLHDTSIKTQGVAMTVSSCRKNEVSDKDGFSVKASEARELSESISFDSTNSTSSVHLVNKPVIPSTTVAISVRNRKPVKLRHSEQQNLVLDLNKKSLSSSVPKYKFSSHEQLNFGRLITVLKQTKIKLPLCKGRSLVQKQIINVPSLNMSSYSTAALEQQGIKGKIRGTAFDKQSSAKPKKAGIVKAQSLHDLPIQTERLDTTVSSSEKILTGNSLSPVLLSVPKSFLSVKSLEKSRSRKTAKKATKMHQDSTTKQSNMSSENVGSNQHEHPTNLRLTEKLSPRDPESLALATELFLKETSAEHLFTKSGVSKARKRLTNALSAEHTIRKRRHLSSAADILKSKVPETEEASKRLEESVGISNCKDFSGRFHKANGFETVLVSDRHSKATPQSNSSIMSSCDHKAPVVNTEFLHPLSQSKQYPRPLVQNVSRDPNVKTNISNNTLLPHSMPSKGRRKGLSVATTKEKPGSVNDKPGNNGLKKQTAACVDVLFSANVDISYRVADCKANPLADNKNSELSSKVPRSCPADSRINNAAGLQSSSYAVSVHVSDVPPQTKNTHKKTIGNSQGPTVNSLVSTSKSSTAEHVSGAQPSLAEARKIMINQCSKIVGSGSDPVECSLCRKKFDTAEALEWHRSVVAYCNHCHRHYTSLCQIRTHWSKICSPSTKLTCMQYLCDICAKKFAGLQLLSEHRKIVHRKDWR